MANILYLKLETRLRWDSLCCCLIIKTVVYVGYATTNSTGCCSQSRQNQRTGDVGDMNLDIWLFWIHIYRHNTFLQPTHLNFVWTRWLSPSFFCHLTFHAAFFPCTLVRVNTWNEFRKLTSIVSTVSFSPCSSVKSQFRYRGRGRNIGIEMLKRFPRSLVGRIRGSSYRRYFIV